MPFGSRAGFINELTAVSKAIAAPPEGGFISIAPPVSRFDTKITVYRLPTTMAVSESLLYALLCILIGAFAATNQGDEVDWLMYLLFYTSVMFPQVAAALPGVVWRDIPVSVMADMLAAFGDNPLELFSEASWKIRGVDELSAPDRQAFDGLVSALTEITRKLHLPTVDFLSPLLPRITAIEELTEIMGHYSLVVYIAGKRVSAAIGASITSKRPKAIESKYFEERPMTALTGKLALGTHAIRMLDRVWAKQGAIRAQLVNQFAAAQSMEAGPATDVFYTTFSLLKYADMHSFLIIKRFLEAYPYAVMIGAIQGDLGSFMSSVHELAAVDPLLRPYYKLMLADKIKTFKRGDIDRLLGVACGVLVTEIPSLRDFEHTPQPGLVREFEVLREKYTRDEYV